MFVLQIIKKFFYIISIIDDKYKSSFSDFNIVFRIFCVNIIIFMCFKLAGKIRIGKPLDIEFENRGRKKYGNRFINNDNDNGGKIVLNAKHVPSAFEFLSLSSDCNKKSSE